MSFTRTRQLVLVLVALLFGGLLTSISSADAVGEGTGGVFVPVAPVRLADTSTGMNTTDAPIASGGTRTLSVLGVGELPTTGVGAVVLDVAGKSTSDANVAVYPYGSPAQLTSLKLTANSGWSSNTVIVKPGTSGKVTVSNSSGSTEINVDVQGYFTEVTGEGAAGGYVPVNPERFVSTEDGIGVPQAQLVGGTTTQVQVGGGGEVPADASAVFANIRVTSATEQGGLKVQASNQASTNATAINVAPGAPHDTGLSVKLGPDGKIKLILSGTSSMKVHVKVDIQGYFSAVAGQGGGFTPLTNSRVYDTANSTPIPANASREVQVAGLAGIPEDGSASAAVMTITAIDWTASGAVRVINPELDGDGTSNIGFWTTSDRSVVSTSIVSISDEGTVLIDNLTDGSVRIVLDAQGYFSGPNDGTISGIPDPSVVDPATDPAYLEVEPTVEALSDVYDAYGDFAEDEITLPELTAAVEEIEETTDIPVSSMVESPPEVSAYFCPEGPCAPSRKVSAFLNVKHYDQRFGNYCGPTSAQIVLNYLGYRNGKKGGPFNQANIAKVFGTGQPGGRGTSFGQMQNGLKNWIGKERFTPGLHPTAKNFRDAMYTNIGVGHQPMFVGTNEVGHTRYNSHPSDQGHPSIQHWIVAEGYKDSRQTVRFDDPSAKLWSRFDVDPKFDDPTNYFVDAFVKPSYGYLA